MYDATLLRVLLTFVATENQQRVQCVLLSHVTLSTV